MASARTRGEASVAAIVFKSMRSAGKMRTASARTSGELLLMNWAIAASAHYARGRERLELDGLDSLRPGIGRPCGTTGASGVPRSRQIRPLPCSVVRLVDPVADIERAVRSGRDADGPKVVAARRQPASSTDRNDAPCGSRRNCSMRWSPHDVTRSVPR